jgi:type II secretory pathway pseudopilin PulG
MKRLLRGGIRRPGATLEATEGSMSVRHRDERGETLVEICIALVIIGAVLSAFFAALATATTASKSQRDLVTADAVLRDYAEATKAAVRLSCASGGTYTVAYAPPSGFSVNALAGQPCPVTTGSPDAMAPQVDFTVSMPNGSTKPLSINVRAP